MSCEVARRASFHAEGEATAPGAGPEELARLEGNVRGGGAEEQVVPMAGETVAPLDFVICAVLASGLSSVTASSLPVKLVRIE
jgi:hypothetical protein